MVDPIQIRITGEDDSGDAIGSAADGLEKIGKAAKAAERPLDQASKGLDDMGDSAKDIDRQMSSLDSAVSKAGGGFRDMAKDAQRAEAELDQMGDTTRRLDKFIGDGGRKVEEYGTGIGGVGDRFDELDTRAMGAADGFAGLTDAMKWNKLTAQEQAMVFSDLGSSMYNFIIPQVQSLGKSLSGLTEKMGGMKNVAIGGAAVIGIGALTAGLMALDQQYEQETSENLDDLSNKLQGMTYASTPANESLIGLMASIGKLDELWERAKAAGDDQAEQFLELAANAGVSEDQIAEYRSELDNKNAAEEAGVTATDRMTEAMKAEADAVRGVNDAVRAATDPLFGMLDAMNQQRDSQAAVNEAVLAYHDAVNKHGEGSSEAADALRTLNDAQDDAVMSAADLESAEADLTAQIKEHPASLSNARNALERWRQQGSITEGQARRMATRFENAADEANRIQGTRTARLEARDNASGKIISAGNRLRELDGSTANVTIQAFARLIGRSLPGASFLGLASGGITPDYSTAAQGGPRSNRVLVGEHGPEIVDLAPGSRVHSNPDTERMLAGGAGAAPALVYQGDGSPLDRALFDYFRDRIRFEHGGDVQRGLGWN
jgi:hypothetical protein